MCPYAIAANDDEHSRAINGTRVFMDQNWRKKGLNRFKANFRLNLPNNGAYLDILLWSHSSVLLYEEALKNLE